jgi:hypothetical protein
MATGAKFASVTPVSALKGLNEGVLATVKEAFDGKFKNTAYVGTNVEYAQHVEYGTRPHEINAPVYISKKVGWRYIKMHPGTKAQSFMRKALDNKRKAIVRIYQAEVKKALSGSK